VRFGQWIRQRTRWFKGWMQTWLVHMRAPGLLKQEMGLRGFLSLQLFVGGTVLAALVHPLFMLFVINDFLLGGFFEDSTSVEESVRKYLSMTILISGYIGSAALGFAGLSRRGMSGSAWVLVTIPVYWLLLSAAAWRALFQLMVAPHYWEKTEHGFARRSPPAPAGAARMPARKMSGNFSSDRRTARPRE
jgi:cellulose synthase/poly-beta-1,6-N-acetylglucosamine synthase-like glycosyltransferase